ncbi:hypothetical protein SAMN04489727_1948 [Amycolatopsis tolypomycina]|uniref:Uncharacterized protein n=1 Tax=Amycolatopsis tolypomycina TaxID=208445 RepID=A0A1H4JJG7_9PSEU|nr:hypothetical protein [Amycolatopsis tolypomycina]SEB46297.1 hypothetical protein SAMN04489727_1948 [Amycolatopsis tolypomycina]
MVTSDEEITRRLTETDTARSARRQQAATIVGELARRHTELAGTLAELERELGEALTAAGDVIDIPELSAVTDVAADDLTRWRDQAAKPARSGKRKRPNTRGDTTGSTKQTATAPRAARRVAPAPPDAVQPVGSASAAAGVGSS